jgi:hypothetical protein
MLFRLKTFYVGSMFAIVGGVAFLMLRGKPMSSCASSADVGKMFLVLLFPIGCLLLGISGIIALVEKRS